MNSRTFSFYKKKTGMQTALVYNIFMVISIVINPSSIFERFARLVIRVIIKCVR